ncbi:MAG: histidinol-phosphatase HisJ family protein [Elusimicrobiota bacterium]
MTLASYHNHTRLSDGSAEPRAMAEAAAAAGLDELGISDHLTLHPDGRQCDWSMPVERLGSYVGAILELPSVRLGLEADFFPETADALRPLLEKHPFDYVIGSVHFAGNFQVDKGRALWEKLSPAERDAVWTVYWDRIAKMAQSRLFDIVGHLDYPKRFGFRTAGIPHHALDAIAEAGMAVELNTAGWHHAAREAYPSPDILKEVRKRGIPILISADAHHPKHLTRDFDKARELARSVGYAELSVYEGRKRSAAAL